MFRVGIVGCGYWGSKHLRVFNELAETTVINVCDGDPERLEPLSRSYPLVYTTTDFEEFLASDIDAVVIATPASTHYQLAKRALLHHKSVLVEKPFTTDSAQALELIHLAEEEGLTLAVGHTFLYNAAVWKLKELLLEGHIGTLQYVHCARLNFGLLQPDVNVLWDLAPHDVSILLYLLERDPLAVGARGVGCFSRQCEVAHADLLFPGSVSAHMHLSWLDPRKVRSFTLVGTQRMVIYDDLGGAESLLIYDREIKFRSENGSRLRYPPTYCWGDVHMPHISGGEPLKEECADFVRSARSGQRPVSDGWMGLRVVRVLESLEKSLCSGGALQELDIVEGRWEKKGKAASPAAPPERVTDDVH